VVLVYLLRDYLQGVFIVTFGMKSAANIIISAKALLPVLALLCLYTRRPSFAGHR